MQAPPSGVFVGRANELAELGQALGTTRSGHGATVLLAGDAGIGKTRLAVELATRARAVGFEALVGRSIDLIGTELPYQPVVEALRPLGGPGLDVERGARSQLHVFEETLSLLAERAALTPVLLVLEDVHWADMSTLDLVVFLAHNIGDRPMLLLVTFREDEPSSAERMRRLTEGVRRSGSASVLTLGPLESQEVTELLAARAEGSVSPEVADAIVARSEGNPFFAEELLAAAVDLHGELPSRVRDLLLHRVVNLDSRTQGLLRVAATAGRAVDYALLCAVAELPEREVRESLRRAVEHGVLVSEQRTGSVRFRHALLSEAVYSTVLPGEREELHARIAERLAGGGKAEAGELAPHWAAAGRAKEALVTSVEAARQAEAVFGLAEALAHLERALALWEVVPDAAEVAEIQLPDLCSWAAELALEIGGAARAAELGSRAISLLGAEDLHRAALLHVRLGEYLVATGSNEAGLAAVELAVELVPAEPPSPERAWCLGTLAGLLMVAWRHAESLPLGKEALGLAVEVGAGKAEVRALTVIGADLAYLGRGEEGVSYLRKAVQLAKDIGDHFGLERAYVNFTDALTSLGRPRESAQVGQAAVELIHRFGIRSTLLASNLTEALLAIGEWDEAERLSSAELRASKTDHPYVLFTFRADLEIGRGYFDAARTHLEAALATLREDHVQGTYDVYVAELALWERRWADADQAVRDGLALATAKSAAPLRVWFCAKGLRAHAELALLARARRDATAVRVWLTRARKLIAVARQAAQEAESVTPNAGGWLTVAEAEYGRARGDLRPESWAAAAAAWDRLERPPAAAYCKWREAEALVAVGAPRTQASVPLRAANAVAKRIGARPLLQETQMLAQRARLDLTPPEPASDDRQQSISESLGLTRREAEVLSLVARGYTDREIAEALVISAKTASVHVSHILRKLGAANRLEAATIAQRLAAPSATTSS